MSRKPLSYETSRGHVLEFRSVSPFMLAEIRASVPDPEKPTYTMQLAGGGVQVMEHDESTLESDEDKAAWAAYIDALKEARAQRSKKVTLAMIEDGIIDCPQPTPEWEAKCARRGIVLPEDHDAKLIKYFEMEIFGSYDDLMHLQTMIMRAGGDLPEEQIEQIEAMFRSAISEQTAPKLAHTAGKVETQQAP